MKLTDRLRTVWLDALNNPQVLKPSSTGLIPLNHLANAAGTD
jgi:hypothetical protein